MSDFLEDVLKPEPVPNSRGRSRPGKPTSPRRYAALLALMAGLTAVPTWIMLRAGVSGLDREMASPAQPLLDPISPRPQITFTVPPTIEPVAPSIPDREMPAPPLRAPTPPEPVPPAPPILERQSVVDTPVRPTRKKPKRGTPQLRPAVPPQAPVVVPPSVVPPTVVPPTVTPPVVQPPVGEPPVFEPPAPEPPADLPPAEEPPWVEPPWVEPPWEEPVGEEPSTEQPSGGQSSVERPAVQRPSVEPPSVDEPSVQGPSVWEAGTRPGRDPKAGAGFVQPEFGSRIDPVWLMPDGQPAQHDNSGS